MKTELEKNSEVYYNDYSTLRLTNDFIFKYVFGREDNSPKLLTLVNAVLEDAGFPSVVSLVIKNSELPKDANWLHSSVLDIRATDENGHGYDIEMQLGHKANFEYRSMYYGSGLYDLELKPSDDYSGLKPIVCISFVDFDLFEGETEFHSCLVHTEINRKHVRLMNGVRLHFIEMKKAQNREGTLAELVRLLQESKPQLEDTMSELLQKNPVYEEIYGDYLHCIEDEQARCDALSREKWLRDYNSDIKYNYNKGHLEGKQEGLEQGARESKIESAKRALAKGFDRPTVAEITGLTEEEINSINNE